MISGLRVRDDDTALAFGQRFDVPRVLDAMLGFAEHFAADLAGSDPCLRPLARFCGEMDPPVPFDGSAVDRFRRETLALTRSWDVAAWPLRIAIGPFALLACPLGCDDLCRFGGRAPHLVDESPWQELDPSPAVQFRAGASILFSEAEAATLREAALRHAPSGTALEFGPFPVLRFLPEAFGLGRGMLRISLLTAPVPS